MLLGLGVRQKCFLFGAGDVVRCVISPLVIFVACQLLSLFELELFVKDLCGDGHSNRHRALLRKLSPGVPIVTPHDPRVFCARVVAAVGGNSSVN